MEQTVKENRIQTIAEALLAARCLNSFDNLVPLVAPKAKHLGNVLGRVLKISVHQNDRIGVGGV